MNAITNEKAFKKMNIQIFKGRVTENYYIAITTEKLVLATAEISGKDAREMVEKLELELITY